LGVSAELCNLLFVIFFVIILDCFDIIV